MVCRLVFPARLDVSSAAIVRDEWLPQLHDHGDVEIDCAALTFMSAAGAQMIVSVATTVREAGGGLALRNLSPSLRGDMILLGLSSYLEEAARHV